MISRDCFYRGPLGTAFLLLLACTWLSLHILDTWRPNTLAPHGAVGLIAGLAIGFLPNRQKIGVSWKQDAWMELLIMALIGSLVGVAIGAVRRAVSGALAIPRNGARSTRWRRNSTSSAPAFLNGSE